MPATEPPHLVNVEDALWICEKEIGVPGYDFRFQDYFACRHPIYLNEEIRAVARMGATNDYRRRHEELLEWKVRLIHSPEEYERTSNLPNWYPLIREFTAKSVWYDGIPTVAEIESEFTWPIFIKGERQTSRHARSMSIIEGPDQFQEVMQLWRQDDILHWQKVVCREYLKLKPVVPGNQDTIQKSFEFRTFWWKDACVGIGPYWNSERYELAEIQRSDLVNLGRKVARLIDVTFLVIDLALRENEQWIVIECNDGQDSGYTGVNPFQLWNNLLRVVGD